MSFKEICNGYGLEPVPATLRGELCCVVCHTTRGKLYTQRPTTSDGTVTGYRKMLDRLRQDCYCRTHTEWYFQGD